MWKKYKKYYKLVVIIIVVCLLFVSGIVVNAKSNEYGYINSMINISQNTKIYIEIQGEVKYPGKYVVKEGTKIKEILYIAGGLLENSDTSLINLNSEIENNDIIYIRKSVTNAKRININTATEKEIASLKNIGTAKAAKIVSYRMTHGSFKTVYDLTNIHGISENTIIDIIDDITLS